MRGAAKHTELADLSELLEDFHSSQQARASVKVNVLASREGNSFCPAADGIGHYPPLHVLTTLRRLHAVRYEHKKQAFLLTECQVIQHKNNCTAVAQQRLRTAISKGPFQILQQVESTDCLSGKTAMQYLRHTRSPERVVANLLKQVCSYKLFTGSKLWALLLIHCSCTAKPACWYTFRQSSQFAVASYSCSHGWQWQTHTLL